MNRFCQEMLGERLLSGFDGGLSKIRVLLVEDCPSMRTAVAALLSQDDRIEIVGIAQDGVHALELVEVLSPDVIVTDLEMPNMHGADFVVQQMSRRAIPIIVFSALELNDPLAELAMLGGAVDFLRKPIKVEEVLSQQQLLQAKIVRAGSRPHQAEGPPG